MATYDLIVIGSGATGQSVALGVRARGWTVAVIDRGRFGGTCPNDGCDAKKPFVNAAAISDLSQRLADRGLAGRSNVDWGAAAHWSASFSDPVDANTRQRLRDAGIEVIVGEARFVDRTAIAVGDRTLHASKVVIATGSRPRPLDIAGAQLARTTTELMAMTEIPHRVAFVGGGFVSFEFGHALARSGHEVTIVHGEGRPLPGFEPDLVERMIDASRQIGIDVRRGHRVCGLAADQGATAVMVADTPAATRALVADLVVHGAGRTPNVDALDLQAAGIAASNQGVLVDDRGRCRGNPDVYAGGDAADTGQPKLLQVASHAGRVIRADLLGDASPSTGDVRPVAVLFTTPELAGVGLTEEQARAAGHDVKVRTGPDERLWKIHRQRNQSVFRYKTITAADDARILGAWVLGEGAASLVNLVALAMANDLQVDDVRRPLYGYPTLSGHVGALFSD